MLRFLQIAVFFLCALTAMPALAVEMRGSDQKGYSRLVFDWGKVAAYQVTQSKPGTLNITFKDEGNIANGGQKFSNILGITVVSQNPLTLSIKIPEQATFRDFQVANRIILDVYDPPGRVQKKEEVSKKKDDKKEKIKEAKKEKKPETPKSEVVKEETKPLAPKEEPIKEKIMTQAPSATKAEVVEVAAKDLPPPVDNRPSNLITMSAVDSVGMAVFERDDMIWLVVDKGDTMLAPQVSGPNARHFLPVENVDIDGGKVFRVAAMDNARIRGQGGGLLWRLVVPAGPAKTKPTVPQRLDDNPSDLRGAKIVWPFEEARRVFKMDDPVSGMPMFVVTVASAKKYAGDPVRFIDFDVIQSPVGLAIVSKVDDLDVAVTSDGNVEVSRPGGLAVTPEETFAAMEAASLKKVQPGSQKNAKRIFDFQNWQMGGMEALDQNRNLIMTTAGAQSGSDRVQGILTLAKMYLSNGLWAEAKGFLDFAEGDMPELNQNPAFIALYGAAQALGWESEPAFDRLSVDELKIYPEIGYWRAFTLADLGDWQQADEVFPDELYLLSQYPAIIRTKLSLVLAEVALRAGDVAKAERLLGFVEDYKDQLSFQQKAAMQYLKGEAARQRKKTDETKKMWRALSRGSDDLYRAKAGLALTRLMMDSKQLPAEKAIDNLERLRYAWRGDELEAQIAYWLGRTYFEHADYVKGLVIMREAAGYAADTDVGRKIIFEMTDVFKQLFMGPALDKVTALDAATLHEQFKDYIPQGAEGDKIAERLAERLVRADLLDKAAQLMQGLVSRLPPADAYRVAMRLAAIHLLNNKPASALAAVDKAEELYKSIPEEMKATTKSVDMSLLRARAMSEQGKFEQALTLLKNLERNPDVNTLRADIAWHAGYWDEAALALADVILDRDISLVDEMKPENTALLLQHAVALNLAGDRVGLASAREKYMDIMSKTEKGKIYEVVTRPRQSAALADRKTLMDVVTEVDLFQYFLQGYKDEPKQSAQNAVPQIDLPSASSQEPKAEEPKAVEEKKPAE